MYVQTVDTLNTANPTETFTLDEPRAGQHGIHTIVFGGVFAAGNALALVANDGVNDRYLGHWDSPGKVSIEGRFASLTATLIDLTDLGTGIGATTEVEVRVEHGGPVISHERYARIIRTIRTAEANSMIILEANPGGALAHTNRLPNGCDRHNSEHAIELVGAIGGGVALTVTMLDQAGYEDTIGIVTNAMLPWKYPATGVIRGDLDQITILVPAGFTTAGLQATYTGSIKEV
jgi:hypothetical protein